MICDVLKTPSIYDAIIDYNKRSGLVDCLERSLLKIEMGKTRPFNFAAVRSDLVKYMVMLQAESAVKVYGNVDSLTADEHRALDRNVEMSMEQRRNILEKARQRCERYNYVDYEHDPQIIKEYLYQLGRGGQLIADNWLYNKLHGYA